MTGPDKSLVARLIPLGLLRGGEDKDNVIQIRGVLEQHVRNLRTGIANGGVHPGTNLLVRRALVEVDAFTFDAHVKEYGQAHAEISLNPKDTTQHVYYYDVFDGNHRLCAVRGAGFEAISMLSCVVHTELLPTALAEQLAAQINDIQKVARENSYADVMCWVLSQHFSNYSEEMTRLKDDNSKKRSPKTDVELHALCHKRVSKSALNSLIQLAESERGDVNNNRFLSRQNTILKLGGWLGWEMIAMLTLMQNLDWEYYDIDNGNVDYAITIGFTAPAR